MQRLTTDQLDELISRLEAFGIHPAWQDEVLRTLRQAKETLVDIDMDMAVLEANRDHLQDQLERRGFHAA